MNRLAVRCALAVLVYVSLANFGCDAAAVPTDDPATTVDPVAGPAIDPVNNPPIDIDPVVLPPCSECPGSGPPFYFQCLYRCDPTGVPRPKLPPCDCPEAPSCSFRCDPTLPIPPKPRLPACNCPGAPRVQCKFICDPSLPVAVTADSLRH